jgi:hypothetical protein
MSGSRQRQTTKEVQERFNANAAQRDAVLESGGRSTTIRVSDRPITRRASSSSSETSIGGQSSTEDPLQDNEDSAAGVEDTSSSIDAEAGISSADVGAGFSSADVGAEISSADVELEV